jgi:hypothetical protein
MTGWIVAGLIGIPLSLIALHFIKKCTALEVENEILQKLVKTLKAQLVIASRPNSTPDRIIDRMFTNDL